MSHRESYRLLIVVVCFTVNGGFLCGDEMRIQEGDKILTLADAPLRVGSETRTTAPAGTELSVEVAKGDWVWVGVEKDGKIVKGWIHRSRVTNNARHAFFELTVRFESRREWIPIQWLFKTYDDNDDDELTSAEFLSGTRNLTLDDLNRFLQKKLAEARKRANKFGGSTWHAFAPPMLLPSQSLTEETWWAFGTRELTPNDILKLLEDFYATEDIRRSRLAQQLVAREDLKVRADRALALFKWADKNRNGRLSFEEFKQALPQPKENGDGRKDN